MTKIKTPHPGTFWLRNLGILHQNLHKLWTFHSEGTTRKGFFLPPTYTFRADNNMPNFK